MGKWPNLLLLSEEQKQDDSALEQQHHIEEGLRSPHLTYIHGMIREDFIRTLRELSRSEDSVTSVTCFGDVRL